MQKLKDCPFCGARPLFEGLRVMEEMDGERTKVFVECGQCGGRGPVKDLPYSLPGSVKIESASMLWNVRRSRVARDAEKRGQGDGRNKAGQCQRKRAAEAVKRGV